ncbi:Inositol-1-monophosphatase [Boseongicola aestuarii]|uniref:Inositol-1-monophosphatase n=2 Tax=Boseongicola aestuarii TaxID=1470561 RepID=A0A238J3P6_9RHOB|nr:Inositol-1-monophosphatase [Boseongicola aestuarii]
MIMSPTTESKLITAVRQIAAEEILPRFRSLNEGDIATKSRMDDLVTVADREAERRLAEVAATLLPDVVVVGEEAVSADAKVRDAIDHSTCLIIDPVDGTWNFANGLATFAVILSISHNGETVWGMIYDPLGDDWAIATRGQGARLAKADGTETRLQYSQAGAPKAAMATGYVHSYLFHGDERQRLFSRLADFHKTDALRCSAHEYRLLSRGIVDFCVSPVLNPWDHAAGCLIVEEAGGIARLLTGEPYRPTQREGRLIVATSEDCWQMVRDTITAPDGTI